MLDNNDVALLKGMFGEILVDNNNVFKTEIKQEFRQGLAQALVENNHVLKREIRDEVHSLIAASETRIITQIADLLHESVFPQITQLQAKLA